MSLVIGHWSFVIGHWRCPELVEGSLKKVISHWRCPELAEGSLAEELVDLPEKSKTSFCLAMAGRRVKKVIGY